MRALLVVCLFVVAVAAQQDRQLLPDKAVRQLEAGEYVEALAVLRVNYKERLQQLGPDAQDTVAAQYLLAYGLQEAGHTNESLELSKKLLDRVGRRATPQVLSELELLYATGLREAGNTDEALRVLRRAMERGFEPRILWRARNQFALSLAYAGRVKEAMDIAVAALAAAPDDPPVRAWLTMTVAQLHLTLGNWREAEATAHRVTLLGEMTAPSRAVIQSTLGVACLRQGRAAEAEEHLREALRTSEALLGPGHPEVGSVLRYLADAVRANGRKVEAAEIRRRSDDTFRRSGASVSIWSLTKRER